MWQNIKEHLSQSSLKIDPKEDLGLFCGICKEIMIDACQIVCRCKFCRDCIESYLQNEGRHCPVNNNEDCRSYNLESMKDVRSDNETNLRLLRIKVKCTTEGCDIEGELLEMIVHVEECRKQYEECDKLIGDKNEEKESDITLEDKVKILEEKVETNAKVINKSIITLEEKLSKEIQRIYSVFVRKDYIEKRIIELNDDFIWKIENYSNKKKNKSCICSEDFYTRKYSYKLRLTCYTNGIDCLGTHLSLYFKLVNGEFDDILSWPFKYDVTLTIIDQESLGRDISVTLKYNSADKYRENFDKPTVNIVRGFGYPKFLEISTLEASSYLLKSDTLYIKCSVRKV